MAEQVSTPRNKITREDLTVLITNNILNNSVEFISDCDCDLMEMDSPIKKPTRLPVSKKLFHSPMADTPTKNTFTFSNEQTRKAKKRKQILMSDNCDKIETAYVKECDSDGYSPDVRGGMRKKILVSLFHNKEYCMEIGS